MQFLSSKELRLRAGEVMKKIKNGERYIITYRGKPVALMLPFQNESMEEVVPRAYKDAWADIEHTLQVAEPVFKNWDEAVKESRRRP